MALLAARRPGRTRAGLLIPSTGRAAQVVARGAAWGHAVVSWTAVNASRFAVYVDGRLVTVTPDPEAVLTSLSAAAPNITVVPLAEASSPSAFRPEWEEGDQALLSWAAVDDPEVAAYRVRGAAGTWDVRGVTIAAKTLLPTGSGTGRLLAGGRFVGDHVNDDLVLTVASGSRLNYEIGEIDGSVPIAQGETAQLPYGAAVTFLDAPEAYSVGDVYVLPLRIDTTFVTPAISRGTHEFTVSAVSAQGVEGETVPVSVFVPAPVVAVSASLAEDEGDIVLNWSVSGEHAAGLAVYSNVDVDGSLMSLIDEITPTARVLELSGLTVIPWDGVSAGILRIQLGVITTWGHTVRQLNQVSMVLPLPPAVLGIPEILSVEQVGTAVRVRFSYTAQEGDQATHIRVTREGVGTWSGQVPIYPGAPGTSRAGEVTVDGSDPDGTTVTITAVATDGTNDGATSLPVQITLYLHEPDAPAATWGAPV